jgi:hypothetical protein
MRDLRREEFPLVAGGGPMTDSWYWGAPGPAVKPDACFVAADRVYGMGYLGWCRAQLKKLGR